MSCDNPACRELYEAARSLIDNIRCADEYTMAEAAEWVALRTQLAAALKLWAPFEPRQQNWDW